MRSVLVSHVVQAAAGGGGAVAASIAIEAYSYGKSFAINPNSPVSGRAPVAGDIGVIFYNGGPFGNTTPTASGIGHASGTAWTRVANSNTGSNVPSAIFVREMDGTADDIDALTTSDSNDYAMYLLLSGASGTEGAVANGTSSGATSLADIGVTSTQAGLMLQCASSNNSFVLDGTGFGFSGGEWVESVDVHAAHSAVWPWTVISLPVEGAETHSEVTWTLDASSNVARQGIHIF